MQIDQEEAFFWIASIEADMESMTVLAERGLISPKELHVINTILGYRASVLAACQGILRSIDDEDA